jgi:hypothetical protein
MRIEKIKVLNILKDSYICVNFEDTKQTHECVSNGYQEYLNDSDVRNSLHVSSKAMPWEEAMILFLRLMFQIMIIWRNNSK